MYIHIFFNCLGDSGSRLNMASVARIVAILAIANHSNLTLHMLTPSRARLSALLLSDRPMCS